MDNNNIILAGYSIAWFLFLFIYRRNNGRFTLGYMLIALYFVLSLITIYVFNSEYAPLYYEPNVTVFPLIYLFVSMLITFIPVISLKENALQYICIPSEKANSRICMFFGFFSLLQIIVMFPQIVDGAIVMMSDSDAITDLYQEATETRMNDKQSGSGIVSLIGVISNLSQIIGPFLFYTYLIQKNRSKWILLLTVMPLLQALFDGIGQASRCLIASSVFNVALLFFFFKPYIETELVSKIRKYAFVVGGVVISLLLTITVARMETQNKTSSAFNIARYMGGATLVFDDYCLDAGGSRGGYKTIPLINRMLGQEKMTEQEQRDKFHNMKINNSRFCSYVGDYVLDYGPLSAFVILCFISLFFYVKLRHDKGLDYSQLIYLYMIFKFCASYYQATFTGIGGNIAIIFLLFGAFYYRRGLQNTTCIYRRK